VELGGNTDSPGGAAAPAAPTAAAAADASPIDLDGSGAAAGQDDPVKRASKALARAHLEAKKLLEIRAAEVVHEADLKKADQRLLLLEKSRAGIQQQMDTIKDNLGKLQERRAQLAEQAGQSPEKEFADAQAALQAAKLDLAGKEEAFKKAQAKIKARADAETTAATFKKATESASKEWPLLEAKLKIAVEDLNSAETVVEREKELLRERHRIQLDSLEKRYMAEIEILEQQP